MTQRSYTNYFANSLIVDKIGTCELKTKTDYIALSSTNVTLLSPVTGKKQVVVAFIVGSDASSASYIRFKDSASSTGGTYVANIPCTPITAGAVVGQFNPAGWFETSKGNYLLADVNSTAAVFVTLRYYEYTP
jgi:hypothetical protein